MSRINKIWTDNCIDWIFFSTEIETLKKNNKNNVPGRSDSVYSLIEIKKRRVLMSLDCQHLEEEDRDKMYIVIVQRGRKKYGYLDIQIIRKLFKGKSTDVKKFNVKQICIYITYLGLPKLVFFFKIYL